LCWFRGRTRHGNFVLTTKPLKKSQLRIDTPSPRLMIYSINTKKPSFNKIDLKSCYQQVPIESTDVWKTTSKFKEGIFEWLVMPFNLTHTPTTFMRIMNNIPRPLTNSCVFVYLNGITILIGERKENLKHIQQVLGTLQ